MREEVTVSLEKALALRDRGALLVDVRTPTEFAAGSIPGAVNVPIFTDEERAEVGTLYKCQGRQAARHLGVHLVAPKIPELIGQVEEAWEAAGRGAIVVFCWRGGMRSKALTSFLQLAGLPARQLVGGHKAFRSLVRDFFERGEWGRLLVLRGLTGVGKTRLLKELAAEGYPVLDLEDLAGHRGSAFGGLGLAAQPSQKQFEALLWDEMRKIPPDGYALSEGESRHIGRLILPLRVYEALQVETSLWIEASLDVRARVILEDYPARAALRDAFIPPIKALRQRLGAEVVERFLELLAAEEWEALARELMLRYYDPLYGHTKPERRVVIAIDEPGGAAMLRRAISELLAHPPRERMDAPPPRVSFSFQ